MPRAESILLVANYEPNVGYAWWLMENYWRVIADCANQQRRTCILSYPVLEGAAQRFEASSVKLERLDFSDTSLRGYVSLTKLLWRYNVRSVYLTDQPYYALRYALMRLCGVRSIVLHDHQPGDRGSIGGFKGALKKFIHMLRVFSCSQYVAVSGFVKERLVQNARVQSEKCVVVKNGIALTQTPQDLTARQEVRREFGIADSAIVVAIVARAHPYKRIDFAVRCAAEIERSYPHSKLHFLFCGDGPAMPDLRQLALELRANSRFTFAGKRADVQRILQGCDLGMHPSQGEVGFCLAILECMAAGLPVIVPRIPSVSGATQHEKTGFLYEDGSVSDAMTYLRLLEEDAALRRTLGDTARSVVASEYDLRRTNAEFCRLVASRL